MKKAVGVVRFPGTNCDQDVFDAVEASGLEARWLWHQDRFDKGSVGSVLLPGGFSYGDYLRCGALAAKSAVMASVAEFAKAGGPVLGICNGFQILCEANLLPGVLTRNSRRRFIDQWVDLKLTGVTKHFGPDSIGEKVKLPVAHGEGNFQIEEVQAQKLFERGQVWWTYNEPLNGSVMAIAGVLNEGKNVAGLMPHPERAMASWMGGVDGKSFFAHLK